MEIEYKGFRVVKGRVNLFKIVNQGSGKVPKYLQGGYISVTSAKERIDFHLNKKETK